MGESVKKRVLVLGEEYPDTLMSMNNLAEVLRDQGKYEAAEEMQRQALELKNGQPPHPPP